MVAHGVASLEWDWLSHPSFCGLPGYFGVLRCIGVMGLWSMVSPIP